ncbi:MAG TPA: hypothetical protein VNV65_12630 [Candidatus Solibacter sp.]|jgi:hypothetical protein|nr:hypothetical protein [Candidatus Solibacter sp.]
MTDKVVGLRKATERPLRIAKTVAVGAAVVVVVGGVAMVVVTARHRAERRSLKRRLGRAVEAAATPLKTTKEAAQAIEKTLAGERQKLRAELREELKHELSKDERTMRQRVISSALKSVASAAVPIVIKQLEQRMSAGSSNGKPGPGRS